MAKMILGKTGLTVCRSGFGALPIQRVPASEAVDLLRRAFDNGINFFDTARMYSDSEEKIGAAFEYDRYAVVIATKTTAVTKTEVLKSIETSLDKLRTDYIDIMQLHNPETLPDPSDPQSSYSGLLEARDKGLVRYIGISNHSLSRAIAAAKSGLYDTVQFPLSSLSSDADVSLVSVCRETGCGLIAMKPLAGGLITNAATTFAFLRQFDNVVPIWGIQKDAELDEFLAFESNPPQLDEWLWKSIRRDRFALSGSFCRGCGYCMPCPCGIQINWAARMSLLLHRAPYQGFLTGEWREKMDRIRTCTKCGQCKDRCPYGIDTPALLEKNLADYDTFYAEHV
jgi:aryl-alcohol dehydrogenase-like predicted oxidoreductase